MGPLSIHLAVLHVSANTLFGCTPSKSYPLSLSGNHSPGEASGHPREPLGTQEDLTLGHLQPPCLPLAPGLGMAWSLSPCWLPSGKDVQSTTRKGEDDPHGILRKEAEEGQVNRSVVGGRKPPSWVPRPPWSTRPLRPWSRPRGGSGMRWARAASTGRPSRHTVQEK